MKSYVPRFGVKSRAQVTKKQNKNVGQNITPNLKTALLKNLHDNVFANETEATRCADVGQHFLNGMSKGKLVETHAAQLAAHTSQSTSTISGRRNKLLFYQDTIIYRKRRKASGSTRPQ